MGIDLLYGSTANAHVLLLRQENHPPPLSWTLVCCYPTPLSSQPSCCHQYPYRRDLVLLLLRREKEDPDQYRHIAVHQQQQVEKGQQQEVNMSADNYLMQEELGSTF
jgi:hypothetical protein